MLHTNYHTHSTFCDGISTLEENIQAAIDKQFSHLGFSSHAPVPFNNDWSMKFEEMDNYKNEITRLQNTYQTYINIYRGLEIDYIPGITHPFSFFKETLLLDYVIGGVHLVKPQHTNDLWFIDGPEHNYINGLQTIYNNDIKQGVEQYFLQLWNMIELHDMDIIAHFDKIKMHNKNRFFDESSTWFINQIDQTLALIKEHNIIVEVNTRGIYKGRCDSLFPGIDTLKKCLYMGIPITISTDAHSTEDLLKLYNETANVLKDLGFKEKTILTKEGWTTDAL